MIAAGSRSLTRSPIRGSLARRFGGTAAMLMLASEDDGLALDFAYSSAAVKDTGTPANDFDGEPNDLLTYSGSSAKWIYNSAGLLVENPAGTLPIDHDPVGLAAKGLLVEEQRTNLLLHSQAFDNAAWTKNGATISANAATSPDGSANAEKLVEDTGTTAHETYQIGKSLSNAAYAWSCYLKAGERTWAALNVYDGTNHITYFDLANGVVGTNAAGNTASIEAVGNGWYRCIVTRTAAATTNGGLAVQAASADGTNSYTGDGTSGIYIWQAQLEAGSFATSPIPTTTVTVTRAADNVSLATSKFPFSATAGTFYVQVSTPSFASSPYLCQVDDGTNNERYALLLDSAGLLWFHVNDGGVAQVDLKPANGVSQDTFFQGRAVYAANDFAATVDGGAIVSDATGTLPTVTTLGIGRNPPSGGGHINGHIKRLVYAPRRVSNADLPTWMAA